MATPKRCPYSGRTPCDLCKTFRFIQTGGTYGDGKVPTMIKEAKPLTEADRERFKVKE